MTFDARTLHVDDVLQIATVGPVFIQRWHNSGTPEDVARMLEHHRAFVAARPPETTYGLSHVVSQSFKPPAPESRPILREHAAFAEAHTRAIVTVITADGFLGSLVRSTVSWLILVTSGTLPHAVRRNVGEGLTFLAEHAPRHEPLDAVDLHARYDALRMRDGWPT